MRMLLAAGVLALFASPARLSADSPRPVPLIFDTDIGNDCDDVLALGVIHSLQSRGECDLKAVTITKDHALAAAFVDAVNTFYGRGEIPIGVCRSGVTTAQGKFNGLAEAKDGDRLRYPHDIHTGEEAPHAVDVLRRALAAAEDRSVVIVQVGFSTNLAALLNSPPDTHSQLDGKQLVLAKVRLLSMMAGAFRQIRNAQGQLYDHKEYNVVKDLPSARRLCRQWPTPILWSGFEIGKDLPYPHASIEMDYRYVKHHPLAEAYRLYNPPPHDRPTWDLTSVLAAVRPRHAYFTLSPPGQVTVGEDGLTRFDVKAGGRDRHLILKDEQKGRAIEALTQLSSQPPTSLEQTPSSQSAGR